MPTPSDAYAELVRRSKELGVVHSCAAVLGWDQQTYMPKGGAVSAASRWRSSPGWPTRRSPTRRSASCWPGRRVPGRRPGVGRRGERPRAAPRLRPGHQAPARLVEELARVTTQAQQVWQVARAKNDFAPSARGWRRSWP